MDIDDRNSLNALRISNNTGIHLFSYPNENPSPLILKRSSIVQYEDSIPFVDSHSIETAKDAPSVIMAPKHDLDNISDIGVNKKFKTGSVSSLKVSALQTDWPSSEYVKVRSRTHSNCDKNRIPMNNLFNKNLTPALNDSDISNLLNSNNCDKIASYLSSNNEENQLIATKIMKHMNYYNMPLNEALQNFTNKIPIKGESQERERILSHFTNRYLECNPGAYKDFDSCHTLVCALMLLNTDLHSQMSRKKMTSEEFVNNIMSGYSSYEFNPDQLTVMYNYIKKNELKLDKRGEQNSATTLRRKISQLIKPLATSNSSSKIDIDSSVLNQNPYISGNIIRKCIYKGFKKKPQFGHRGWKLQYASVIGLKLLLFKTNLNCTSPMMTGVDIDQLMESDSVAMGDGGTDNCDSNLVSMTSLVEGNGGSTSGANVHNNTVFINNDDKLSLNGSVISSEMIFNDAMNHRDSAIDRHRSSLINNHHQSSSSRDNSPFTRGIGGGSFRNSNNYVPTQSILSSRDHMTTDSFSSSIANSNQTSFHSNRFQDGFYSLQQNSLGGNMEARPVFYSSRDSIQNNTTWNQQSKLSATEDINDVLPLHHCFAKIPPKARHKNMFALYLADMSEYHFRVKGQYLNKWINSINLASALHSAPPIGGAGHSDLYKPLMPAYPSDLDMEAQKESHEKQIRNYQSSLEKLNQLNAADNGVQKNIQFCLFEIARFTTYVEILTLVNRSNIGPSNSLSCILATTGRIFGDSSFPNNNLMSDSSTTHSSSIMTSYGTNNSHFDTSTLIGYSSSNQNHQPIGFDNQKKPPQTPSSNQISRRIVNSSSYKLKTSLSRRRSGSASRPRASSSSNTSTGGLFGSYMGAPNTKNCLLPSNQLLGGCYTKQQASDNSTAQSFSRFIDPAPHNIVHNPSPYSFSPQIHNKPPSPPPPASINRLLSSLIDKSNYIVNQSNLQSSCLTITANQLPQYSPPKPQPPSILLLDNNNHHNQQQQQSFHVNSRQYQLYNYHRSNLQ